MKKLLIVLALLNINLAFANAVDSSRYTWKGLFIAGDNSIQNFDQGRLDLSNLFYQYGQNKVDQKHFSVKDLYLNSGSAVRPTMTNLTNGFKDLSVDAQADGCLVHMTSHGGRNRGFYLAGIGMLKTAQLDKLINDSCGKAPTVVLISACFSGQFITNDLKGPNRIILTAARQDVPSFGCSPDTKYTYWDGCLIQELPNSTKWSELYKNVSACIELKESRLGTNRSYPQAFFGANVADMNIVHK